MWVAKDKDGRVGFYEFKPERSDDMWNYIEGGYSEIEHDEYLFPDLKWEDDPIEVEIVSKSSLNEIDKISEKLHDFISKQEQMLAEIAENSKR